MATKRKHEEKGDEQDAAKKQAREDDQETKANGVGPAPAPGVKPPAPPPTPPPTAGGGGLRPSSAAFSTLPPSVQAAFGIAFDSGAVQANELDESIWDSLNDFHESVALQIGESFSRANLSTIRNKTGYLIGILKQYRNKGQGLKRGGAAVPAPAAPAPQAAASPYGYPGFGNPFDPYGMYAQMYAGYPGMEAGIPGMPAMPAAAAAAGVHDYCAAVPNLAVLPSSVKLLLNGVFAKGQVLPTDIDASVWDSMKDFDENTQCQIVERFSQSNLSTVRNKTGYFIGILKIFRQGGGGAAPKAPAAHPPAVGAYGAMAAYGAIPGFAGYSLEAFAPPDIVPPSAGGRHAGAFSALPMQLQLKFQELYNSGRLRPGEVEDSVFDSLKDFDEYTQMSMVDNFCNTDLSSIRNKTAFFIGILKRQRQARAQGGMQQH